jgi:hypothetical protein
VADRVFEEFNLPVPCQCAPATPAPAQPFEDRVVALAKVLHENGSRLDTNFSWGAALVRAQDIVGAADELDIKWAALFATEYE